MNASTVFWLLAISMVGAGCQTREAPEEERIPMTLQLTSSAFGEGQTIPAKHTGDGQDGGFLKVSLLRVHINQ